jgi:hypothetical protein
MPGMLYPLFYLLQTFRFLIAMVIQINLPPPFHSEAKTFFVILRGIFLRTQIPESMNIV